MNSFSVINFPSLGRTEKSISVESNCGKLDTTNGPIRIASIMKDFYKELPDHGNCIGQGLVNIILKFQGKATTQEDISQIENFASIFATEFEPALTCKPIDLSISEFNYEFVDGGEKFGDPKFRFGDKLLIMYFDFRMFVCENPHVLHQTQESILRDDPKKLRLAKSSFIDYCETITDDYAGDWERAFDKIR